MYFDVAMPLTLFLVTLVSMFLNQKTESKLKPVFEEREFGWKDTVVLVAAMAIAVSVIYFIPDMALMTVFLFSYSMLLFTFGYVFSNKRWYVAVLPPTLFVLLYLFFSLNGDLVWVWSEYLVNVYALVFAVLITLYLGSMFKWKTTLIFAGLLTIMDVILVLVTKTMISAATTATSLNLPVVVMMPILPALNGKMLLGLGDFFFAGLLATQSFKKFGKKFGILSVIAMVLSFAIFEAALLTYRVGAFPGTVMIITGWLPLALWKSLTHQRKNGERPQENPKT